MFDVSLMRAWNAVGLQMIDLPAPRFMLATAEDISHWPTPKPHRLPNSPKDAAGAGCHHEWLLPPPQLPAHPPQRFVSVGRAETERMQVNARKSVVLESTILCWCCQSKFRWSSVVDDDGGWRR